MKELLDFCKTPNQTRVIEAMIEYGTVVEAAKALNITHQSVSEAVKRVQAAANIYHSPGFNVKGKSTLFDSDGNVKIEWVKTERNKEQDDLLIESITETFEAYKGIVKPVKQPKKTNKDLLTVYPMGDPHIGLYAWSEETGNDFDCDIAERDLLQAVANLVDLAPNSETAIILNLGDFFHSDNQSSRTKSGNVLDCDTRWARVLQIGIKIMIQCVELALMKHKKVIVKNVIGNHDDHTSIVLAIALANFFHKNKRVEIDTSPAKFWYYKFGRCLFGTTHGDTVKPDKLGEIMANDRPKDWGDTEYRFWLTGHVHHDHVKDYIGCRFESFRTLAAADAWHTASGYRSKRDMKVITYDKNYGEDSRFTMSIARLTG